MKQSDAVITTIRKTPGATVNSLCFSVSHRKAYSTQRINMDKSMHVLCDYLELFTGFTDKFLKIIKQLTLLYMKKTKLDVVPKRIHVRLHTFQSNCMKIELFRT